MYRDYIIDGWNHQYMYRMPSIDTMVNQLEAYWLYA